MKRYKGKYCGLLKITLKEEYVISENWPSRSKECWQISDNFNRIFTSWLIQRLRNFKAPCLSLFFFPPSLSLSERIPINVTVMLFYEKTDFRVYGLHLTPMTLKVFKLKISSAVLKADTVVLYNLKLVNKPSMTPALLPPYVWQLGQNWSCKLKRSETVQPVYS